MTRRRKKTSRPTVPAAEPLRKKRLSAGLLISIILTLLLGGIPFGYGKYIELNSPGPFDSGAYVYSAKHLLDGAKMGVDELPSARPGTLIANIIGVKLFGFNDVGPKIVQMILQLAALIFMFLTLRKVFGSVAAVIGTSIAAVYLSAPLIAKFGNVKEQFMIAFMVYAACAFLWYACTQKKVWLALSGFFALQPYYFKPTGMSVVFALVLYILIGNAFSRKWKTLWTELALFLCGYAAGMIIPGGLYLWQESIPRLLKSFPPLAIALGAGILLLTAIPMGVHLFAQKKNITAIEKIPQWVWAVGLIAVLPIVAFTQWGRILNAAGLKGGGYLTDSLAARGLDTLAPQVFRYYKALSVPILGALCSVIIAATVWIHGRIKKRTPEDIQSKLAWILAVWWVLDMVFVWISPRSYEQYYLPLCASAAMLSGYAVWKWQQQLKQAANKMPWLAGGLAAVITLGCLSISIFTGQRTSPDTGLQYQVQDPRTGQVIPIRRRGFGPALKELPGRKQGAWVAVGTYIQKNSDKNDTIYVWGWVPGIYVQAQRMAPVPKAFESNMHVTPPKILKRQINSLVNTMKKNPPKFIVDSRKRHFPNDRPPLELWPIVPAKMFGNEQSRLLSQNPGEIAAYDNAWETYLETKINPDEAQRYRAMKPFRDFVMNHYKVITRREFGGHIIFERID